MAALARRWSARDQGGSHTYPDRAKEDPVRADPKVAAMVLLAASVLGVGEGVPQAKPIPAEVRATLDTLRKKFVGAARDMGAVGYAMHSEVSKHREAMDELLEYSRGSEENRDRLAACLLADLGAFAERYRPGVSIDAEVLARRTYAVGSAPDSGLGIEACLLLETARDAGSAPFTRHSLGALYEVVKALAYLDEQRILHRRPEQKAQMEREQRANGGHLTCRGAEIAWACEVFLCDAHLAKPAYLPKPIREVLGEYWEWRRMALLRGGSEYGLDISQMNRTMEYVQRVIWSLPASDTGMAERRGQ